MTNLSIRLRAVLTLCACAALIGCGGGGGSSNSPASPESVALGEHTLGWDPLSNVESAAMTLTVSGTGQAQGYAWDFGDGSTTTTTTPTAQHRFKRGDYTVRVTVTGVRGDTKVVTKALSVLPGVPTVRIDSAIPLDMPLMPGTAMRFAAGLGSVSWDDKALGPNDDYTYAWDFGDGASSNRPAPLHAYAKAGRYTISLKVRDRLGREFPASSTVEISPVTAYPLLSTLGGWNEVDGGPNGQLPSSLAMARLPDGTLVLAGLNGKAVRTLSPGGALETLAGAPDVGGLRDGRGGEARFAGIQGLSAGGDGTFFVHDAYALRAVSADGVVKTLLLNGGSKDGPIGEASTAGVTDIAGSGGDLYFAESTVLRRIHQGRVETLAGHAEEKIVRDGTAAEARFANIVSMAADDRGRVWLIDDCSTLRRRETDGSVRTVWTLPEGAGCQGGYTAWVTAAANGSVAVAYLRPSWSPVKVATISDAGLQGTPRQLKTYNSFHFLVDGANYLIAEWTSGQVHRLYPDDRMEELAGIDVRGNRFFPAQLDDSSARFGTSSAPTILSDGALVFASNAGYGGGGGDLKTLVLPGQYISTLMRRDFSSRDGVQGWATIRAARLVAAAPMGGLIFLDDKQVRRRDADGTVTTLAGHPTDEGDADGDAATSRFKYVNQLAADSRGNAYLVADNRLAKVSPDGQTTTVLRAKYPIYRLLVGRDDRPIITQGAAFYRVAADGALTLLTGRDVDAANTPADWIETSNVAAAVHPDGSLWLLDRHARQGPLLRRLDADGTVRTVVAVRDILYKAHVSQDPYQLPLGYVDNMVFSADGQLILSTSNWTSFWRISDLPAKAP